MHKHPKQVILSILVALLLAACSAVSDEPLPTLASIAAIGSATSTPPPELRYWQTATGTLANEREVDLWRFTGAAGSTIRLRVVERGGVTPTLQLQNASGDILAFGPDLRAELQQDGEYVVAVQLTEAGVGGYELGLSYADQPNPSLAAVTEPVQVVGVPTPTPAFAQLGTFIQQLNGNISVSGTLTDTAPAHIYTLAGTAGEFVSLEMQATSGSIDPVLYIYNAEGVALAMDDNSGTERNARLRNIRLPEDGLYSIRAWGDGFTGAYTLQLAEDLQPTLIEPTNTPAPPTPTPFVAPTIAIANRNDRLVDHVPIAGTLSSSGDFARFAIAAEAGQTLAIGVNPLGDSGLRPQFELFDLDGSRLADARGSTSNNAGGAFTYNIRIDASGTYTLIVTGEDGTQGSYLVSYGVGLTIRDIFYEPPEPDTRVFGDIAYRGLRDVWPLTLQAGDALNVAVTPQQGTLDPVVELTDSAGNLIASDDNSGGDNNALLRLARIPQDGLYLLRVRDARSDGIGTYTLIWRYAEQAVPATPVPPETPVLTVDDVLEFNQYAFFPFQGQRDQQITVRVVAQGASLDPVAALIGPDGETLIEADDSEGTLNPSFSTRLPADGTYAVRVNGYLSAGPFELRVTTR